MLETEISILVVEDNPLFLQHIDQAVDCLEIANKSYCETGAQALMLLGQASTTFNLALVDLGLPDIDGVKIVSAVRQRFPDIPIMVITVISSEKSLLESIRAGANGYILKSDPSTSIRQAIDDVLHGNYPISPSLARTLFKLAGSPVAGKKTDQFNLTPREIETLKHISRGHSYEETSKLMGISLSTIQSNIRSLYRKMDAHSQIQAISKARSAGMI